MDPLASHYDHSYHDFRPYGGQLDPAFQEKLRALHAGVDAHDCHFYHTLVLGDGSVVPGGWDIRGNERNYLGHARFKDLSVLEFGPASGYLSFWMEEQGANVTVVDLPPGFPPDLVPSPGMDLQGHGVAGSETARQVRNSWWYGHQHRNSKARAVYANIYKLPGDIGRYDVSTFGSILLHLSNPFLAMREAAQVTDKAMIVTDIVPDIAYGDESNSFLEINPGNESANLVNWWRISPPAMVKMLRALGFPFVDIHYFKIVYHPLHDPSAPPICRFMYTAVGQRSRGALERFEKSPAELTEDTEVRQQVPRINVEVFNDAHRRLQVAEAARAKADEWRTQLERVYRSLPWKLSKPWRMLFGY